MNISLEQLNVGENSFLLFTKADQQKNQLALAALVSSEITLNEMNYQSDIY